MTENWLAAFPPLAALPDDQRQRLLQIAQIAALPAGQTVFHDGGACANYLMVIDGSVRVQMVAESGREIVLYRVEKGQTCVLTTSCLMAGEDYNAEGLTETDVTAAILPAAAFQDLLATSRIFRAFVFSAYGTRVNGLLALIEEVAFGRIDQRLAQFLLDRGRESASLPLTHQDIAVELGSAREVISRQLKEFERRGLVRLARGRIDLADREGLGLVAK
ncbi:Crp/Fnr family transcriptional regulator [Magnetospira sp. QH-2]|uniref:Crp/Fnr family transcriptional regulator n=1 Tax=Magnetospira sp. (strain QH-2) TaxID=1288970 RepID=UPI0003E817BF|nr:Crp/Fnr family transcriptional regulator [Magnetospira sp. QH-2]CCQ72445.1 Putative cAMP-binding transcriptional regulator (Crp/Fnr family) [Magnetospira sp. QH-2]